MSGAESSVQAADRDSGAPVVRLAGEIDISTADGIADTLCAVPGSTVVVDLSDVTFMDSSGIAELMRARQARAASGHDLIIRGASKIVRKTFLVLGLEEMLAE